MPSSQGLRLGKGGRRAPKAPGSALHPRSEITAGKRLHRSPAADYHAGVSLRGGPQGGCAAAATHGDSENGIPVFCAKHRRASQQWIMHIRGHGYSRASESCKCALVSAGCTPVCVRLPPAADIRTLSATLLNVCADVTRQAVLLISLTFSVSLSLSLPPSVRPSVPPSSSLSVLHGWPPAGPPACQPRCCVWSREDSRVLSRQTAV